MSTTLLVQVNHPRHGRRWAVRDPAGDRLLPPEFRLGTALAGDLAGFRQAVEPGAGVAVASRSPLAAPVDAWTEIWAAGVTYARSLTARMEESRNPDIYDRVYDAERPELFFKSLGWRVAGTGEPIAVRPDSRWDVPEPELAVVVAASGEIAGYTACNDVSSRSIEGDNPLYLPQAKSYLGATALGPGIRPAWEVPDPYDLAFTIRLTRDGTIRWEDAATTGRLHRRLDDLVGHLFRADLHPHGVVLSTGTCLVPDESVTLRPGDVVDIEIAEVGRLTNPVVSHRDATLRARRPPALG
jgi:2-dehydro-3-deoxy-D-arabinonate dehydratase